MNTPSQAPVTPTREQIKGAIDEARKEWWAARNDPGVHDSLDDLILESILALLQDRPDAEGIRNRGSGWQPMSAYRDHHGFVLLGLWVTNRYTKQTVWEVYKGARDCDCDQAVDEHNDIITEWPWSAFEAFMVIPAPPSLTTTAETKP